MIEEPPLPATDDPLDAEFWAAALRGELVVQRCEGCGRLRFPPRPRCPHCQRAEHAWARMSGRGTVWSFAVPHPPLLPVFEAVAPYVVAVIALDEDPAIRLVGNLVAANDGPIEAVRPDAVRIGAPVRLAFRHPAPDVALPCWILA